jgi:AAHS family 3-hydroxyphenylpropionic acid transporter
MNTLARRSTIIFCLGAALCEGIDLQAAGVAATGIAAEFKPTADQFGTFFSASTLGLFVGALLGGRLADSIGRKKVLVASVGVFGLFCVLTAFANDVQSLTWARLLTGLGLGGALPILIALVSESGRDDQQSTSVAMVYAAAPFGGAVASVISLLIPAAQWRVIFIVGGVLPLLLAPLMALRLSESVAYRHMRSEATAKAGSFIALLAEGRALRTLLLWLSFFLGLLLLYLLLNWLPMLLVTKGLTRSAAAGAQIGFNVGGSLAALLVGYLLGSRLRNPAIVFIFVTIPILLVVLAQAPAEAVLVAAAVFFLGCAVVSAQAFLYAMAPIAYPTSIRGVGVGATIAIGRIGSIVGPKLGGYLKSAGHTPSQLLMDVLPLVVAGSISALLLAWISAPKARPMRSYP